MSRLEWVIARRREAPDEGPGAVRRAELLADLRAERRLAERIEAERGDRRRALEGLRSGSEHDGEIVRAGDGPHRARAAQEGVAGRRDRLAGELESQPAAGGEQAAAALRGFAHEEAEIQGRL